MLISVEDLKGFWGVRPRGVLHVGAHEAEESSQYAAHGWGPVCWVEMLPDKAELLRTRFAGDPESSVLQAACWNEDGVELPAFRASNGQSSSLLRPHLHREIYPSIVFQPTSAVLTSRLDSILPADFSFEFINLDLQGAELRALEGLGDRIETVRWAYVEVNNRALYRDCPMISDIDEYLRLRGFRRVATRWWGDAGWGDALYVRVSSMNRRKRLALRLKQLSWWISNKYARAG